MAEPKKKRGNPNFHKGMKPLNPAGRTKGSVNKYAALSRELMSAKGPEIVAKVLELALADKPDVNCLKMCMDRILPAHKAVDSSRTKADAQVIINVASIESIKQKIEMTPDAELVEPEEMSDDEVIVNIDLSPMADKFDE